jgi:hypothetical protein
MNRSYSKIRHIQEANLKLEKRLMNEQLLGTAGLALASDPLEVGSSSEMGLDMAEKLGHTHFGKEEEIPEPKCLEFVPNRDQAWTLIQNALKSSQGSVNLSNPDIVGVHNAIATGDIAKIKQVIPQMWRKLKNEKDFSSFVKSYNAKGFDLFKDLDKFNVAWNLLIPLVSNEIIRAFHVTQCKKWEKRDLPPNYV